MYKKTLIISIIAFVLFNSVAFALNIGLDKNINRHKLGDNYPVAVSPDQSRAAILERAKLFKVHLITSMIDTYKQLLLSWVIFKDMLGSTS